MGIISDAEADIVDVTDDMEFDMGATIDRVIAVLREGMPDQEPEGPVAPDDGVLTFFQRFVLSKKQTPENWTGAPFEMSQTDVSTAKWRSSEGSSELSFRDSTEPMTVTVGHHCSAKARVEETGKSGQEEESKPMIPPLPNSSKLSLIMPERGRLIKMMVSEKVVSERGGKQAILDLYSFITRDHAVLYRPGEEPIDGTCHVEGCWMKMEGLHEDQRAIHIYTVDNKKDLKKLSSVHRPTWLIAFNVLLGPLKKNGIPISHSISIQLVRKDVVYCQFCLSNETFSAEKKLQAWTRDSDLTVRLEKYISQVHWPSPCPRPLCDAEANDGTSCWHSLRGAGEKGQKRRWEAVTSGNNDDLQPGTPHRFGGELKIIRLEETDGIEVIEYSTLYSFKSSPTSANRNSPREKRSRGPRQQLVTSMDPAISLLLISLSSISLTVKDHDRDTERSTVPGLTYIGNSPPDSSTPCSTESYGSTRGNYDRDGSPSLLGF
ncbi:hypothetical protein FGG08_002245 [Glutinoglossum americanum]|uniref:Uncharacterized protein n=1 Tax=Glutinoglossum americanum TaxID=1670608 RepID=A0A9P8I562_9PEZI|nr:hypothetical protein FGG08_002245 [Glutinoglossum americanum]